MLGFEASNPGSSRLEDDPVAGLPLVSASGVEAMATAGDVISIVDSVDVGLEGRGMWIFES